MKITLKLLLLLALSTTNLYSQVRSNASRVSLSQNEYNEFNNDSIIQIGDAFFNVNTNQIVGVNFDYFRIELNNEVMGRWLAVDPLAVKYPSLSVYNFVGNSPLVYIDPDGKKIKPVNGRAEKAVEILYNKYKYY